MNFMNDSNPHNVFDGKWGGWGPSYWHYGKGYGFADRDVVEWDADQDGAGELVNRRWVRVWVDADQSWRDLTAEEVARLPDFTQSSSKP